MPFCPSALLLSPASFALLSLWLSVSVPLLLFIALTLLLDDLSCFYLVDELQSGLTWALHIFSQRQVHLLQAETPSVLPEVLPPVLPPCLEGSLLSLTTCSSPTSD